MRLNRNLSGAIACIFLTSCSTAPKLNSGSVDWDANASVSTPVVNPVDFGAWQDSPMELVERQSATEPLRRPATEPLRRLATDQWETLTVFEKIKALEDLSVSLTNELQPWRNPNFYLFQIFSAEVTQVRQTLAKFASESNSFLNQLNLRVWVPAESTGVFQAVDKEILRIIGIAATISKLMNAARDTVIYRPDPPGVADRLNVIERIVTTYNEKFANSRLSDFGVSREGAIKLADLRVLKRALRFLFNQGSSHLVEIRRGGGDVRKLTPPEDLKRSLNKIFFQAMVVENGLRKFATLATQRKSVSDLKRTFAAIMHPASGSPLKEMKSPSLVDLGDIDGSRGAMERAVLLQASFLAVEYLIVKNGSFDEKN